MKLTLIAVLALLTIHSTQLQAEDVPSKEHVLGFLKDKMPQSLELLDQVRAEEGADEYEKVLENARELLMEFLEIKREDGVEAAEAFVKEERDRVLMEFLVESWHDTKDEARRNEMEKEIAGLIGAQIDRELAHGRKELESLIEDVEAFEAELKDIEENRETIIAEELSGILSNEREEEEQNEARVEKGGENQEFSVTQSWSQEKDYKRPYWVNVPEQGKGKLPVLIFLHGNGGNAKGARNMILHRYPKLSRQFITVFAQGYKESWNIVSERSKANDREFIEAIILEIAKQDNFRKDAFTIMGVSNGAALANQIAIESQLPNIKNIITSVSPLNGYQHDGENFKVRGDDNNYNTVAKPRAGRRLLNISGTNDPLVPYKGGPSRGIPAKDGKLPFVDAEESIFLWAKQMGYEGGKLSEPSEVKGEIAVFSYLDGNVVHFKVNEHGHKATEALSERLLSDFLRDGAK
jgi:poly(3-hydroxybutyrate) depolymerase